MKTELLACALLCLAAANLLFCQEMKNTGYPPSVYMHEFHPCSSDTPCERTEEFRVDPEPGGCCILTVTNGNGLGEDEVHSYEVFLNGERVIPNVGSRNAQATVKVAKRNTLKAVLTGERNSKVFILVAYDPHKK
jgi:hypothetical protein